MKVEQWGRDALEKKQTEMGFPNQNQFSEYLGLTMARLTVVLNNPGSARAGLIAQYGRKVGVQFVIGSGEVKVMNKVQDFTRLRESSGLSMRALAKATGLTLLTMFNLEHGKSKGGSTARNILAVSKVLGCAIGFSPKYFESIK